MRETAMERKSKEHLVVTREVVIPVENKKLAGILTIPNEAQGLVVLCMAQEAAGSVREIAL
jgi:hypothetical protein